MGAANIDVTPCTDDGHANGTGPRPKDAPGEADVAPDSLMRYGFSPPQGAASNDVTSVPGSIDIVGLGIGRLGLLGYPQVPLLPAS
jgi:hypothetical protein